MAKLLVKPCFGCGEQPWVVLLTVDNQELSICERCAEANGLTGLIRSFAEKAVSKPFDAKTQDLSEVGL